jgi:hypothetical protein
LIGVFIVGVFAGIVVLAVVNALVGAE